MQRINRGIDTTGAGTVRQLCIAGLFSLLFLLATGTQAQALECIECHNPSTRIPAPHDNTGLETSCLQTCHSKDLNQLRHPTGPGTPLTGDRTTTCRTCHNLPFPGVYHPYTINVSGGSQTPDGYVDLDQACGQCHGGGVNSTDNPPKPNVAYLTKMQLGIDAKGMHGDRPSASFGCTFAVPNTLLVNVDASGSACINVCDAYDWDWGDGAQHSSGVAASHTYAPGIYRITLTVTDNGVGRGTFSQQITVVAPDSPPTAAGCGPGTLLWDANTWTATCNDASTDDLGVMQVTVSWGDGSVLASDTTSPFGPFSRTYLAPKTGGYTITHKAIDTIGQSNTETATVSPAYFTISGTVFRSNGTTGVPSATVTVKQGTKLIRTVYTASNGTFSVGTLKPGTYTLTVTKSGYTFTVPTATITVGPSSAGNRINALTP